MTHLNYYKFGETFRDFLTSLTSSQEIQVGNLLDQQVKAYKYYLKDNNPRFVAMEFNRLIDKEINESLIDYTGKAISCKKNCSYCCEMNVEITREEAALLLNYTKTMNLSLDWDKLKFQKKRGLDNWHLMNKNKRKCIFLNDGVCQVYIARPSNCRLYMSIDNPLKCDVSTNNRIQKYFSAYAEILGVAIHTASESSANIPTQLIKYKDEFFR